MSDFPITAPTLNANVTLSGSSILGDLVTGAWTIEKNPPLAILGKVFRKAATPPSTPPGDAVAASINTSTRTYTFTEKIPGATAGSDNRLVVWGRFNVGGAGGGVQHSMDDCEFVGV